MVQWVIEYFEVYKNYVIYTVVFVVTASYPSETPERF